MVFTSLNIILFIEEELIREKLDFKLRFVMLEGLIETLINKKIAFEMLGPGLTEARARLSTLKESNRRFYISLDNEKVSEILNSSFFRFNRLSLIGNPKKIMRLRTI